MKVEGPGGPKSSSSSKKSASDSAAGVDFSSFVRGGGDNVSGAGATQSITHLDALLSVQATEDPTARAAKKRLRERADGILQELEKIRMAMLGGNLTVGHMIDVADVIASHRDRIQDPLLMVIMDEIDLRAQVELAKMRVALDLIYA